MTYAAMTAITISLLALSFTIGSFWWVNARRAKLVGFEPKTWAGYVKRRSALRLPVLIHNPGAVPVVVREMRVRFVEDGSVLDWEWNRATVYPTSDDNLDATRPFSVPGRSTFDFVPEFRGAFPGVVPEPRPYDVVIEVRTGTESTWTKLFAMTLMFQNFTEPSSYIAYLNDPHYLSADQLAKAVKRLNDVRAKLSPSTGDVAGEQYPSPA